MNIYLAGPMRGYPEFNFPAFHAAADYLRARGHTVFSPAENDIEKGYSQKIAEIGVNDDIMRDCIFDDLKYIIRHADTIALLPGWRQSKGVAAELATARFLDLEVFELQEEDFYDRLEQVQ